MITTFYQGRGAFPLIAGAALALAGCDRGQPAQDPAPSPAPTAQPSAEKVSIIRDDVGLGDREPAPPMAPLAVRIGFDGGGSTLSDAAVASLREALASDQMKAGGGITLGGHTDSAGNDAANLRASRKRAEAVRDWLVKNGVDEDRITVVAFGEQNPAAPNAKPDGTPDEAGRAMNRRVDLAIAVPPGTPPAAEASGDGTLVEEIAGPDRPASGATPASSSTAKE